VAKLPSTCFVFLSIPEAYHMQIPSPTSSFYGVVKLLSFLSPEDPSCLLFQAHKLHNYFFKHSCHCVGGTCSLKNNTHVIMSKVYTVSMPEHAGMLQKHNYLYTWHPTGTDWECVKSKYADILGMSCLLLQRRSGISQGLSSHQGADDKGHTD
jgi:hypothetical protein